MVKIKQLHKGSLSPTYAKYGECCVINKGYIVTNSRYWYNSKIFGCPVLAFPDFMGIKYGDDLYIVSRETYEIIREYGFETGLQVAGI